MISKITVVDGPQALEEGSSERHHVHLLEFSDKGWRVEHSSSLVSGGWSEQPEWKFVGRTGRRKPRLVVV